MSEAPRFSVRLERIEGFEFKVSFDWADVPELTLDEPEPIGRQRGPNAARMVAAAVGNCLAASLLFCLQKSHAEPRGIRATVGGRLTRNERGRQRIGGLDVRIEIEGPFEEPSRLERCLDLFEDYCLVTGSVRAGIPVEVEVVDSQGRRLRGPGPK